jgi:hypothetical protein
MCKEAMFANMRIHFGHAIELATRIEPPIVHRLSFFKTSSWILVYVLLLLVIPMVVAIMETISTFAVLVSCLLLVTITIVPDR